MLRRTRRKSEPDIFFIKNQDKERQVPMIIHRATIVLALGISWERNGKWKSGVRIILFEKKWKRPRQTQSSMSDLLRKPVERELLAL